ncbi:MAG: rod shape-determining protein RodA [Bdellovibrionales bacterium]
MSSFDAAPISLPNRLRHIPWGFVVTVAVLGLLGVVMLYSAGNMSWEPWGGPHLLRLAAGLVLLVALAVVNIRTYLHYAYVVYAVCLVLLVAVELVGQMGMGAQRWINLGFIVLQPSELMKIAVVLALARYFHNLTINEIRSPLRLVFPAALVAMPIVLVLLQPNLGTAMLIGLGSVAIFWAAGVRVWIFLLGIIAVVAAVPIAFEMLHDYQKTRILTFLDPASDPSGAGYNILQSTIALGAGGFGGRGLGLGTQSQLQFLPEKHTDFIFVVLAEELGWIGAMITLALYGVLLAYSFLIAMGCRHDFGRLVAIGLMFNLFLYIMVNVAMVSGLIPVVGIPLPLLSYGGTAMLTMMISCGILLSVAAHRDARISKGGNVGLLN